MKDNKKYIMVTEKGVGAQNMQRSEILAWLLYAFLSVWEEDNYEIDKVDVSCKILDLLNDIGQPEADEYDVHSIFDILFDNDDDEGNG